MFSPKHHILYVESHEDTRLMVKMMLEKSGFLITATGDDKECLEHLTKNHYDLILLEHTAFGLSGLALCLTIRELDRITPILFFSSRAYPKDQAAAMLAGAQGYLIKPSDLFNLSGEISRLIEASKQVKTYYHLSESHQQVEAETEI